MSDLTTYSTTPKVCVQCLASYNASRLIFEWADAADLGEIEAARDRVAERAVEAAKATGEYPVYFGDPEEFMLADWEGFPSGTVGEYSNWEFVAELGAAIEEHGEEFLAYLSLGREGSDFDVWDAVSAFEQARCGEYDSLKDYAYEYVAQGGVGGIAAGPVYEVAGERVDVIDTISAYLDWDLIARDLEQDFSAVTVESRDAGGIKGFTTYIFRENA